MFFYMMGSGLVGVQYFGCSCSFLGGVGASGLRVLRQSRCGLNTSFRTTDRHTTTHAQKVMKMALQSQTIIRIRVFFVSVLTESSCTTRSDGH